MELNADDMFGGTERQRGRVDDQPPT